MSLLGRLVAVLYLPLFAIGWTLVAGDEAARRSVHPLVRGVGAGLLILLAAVWLASVTHALLRRRYLTASLLMLLNFLAVPFYLWKNLSEGRRRTNRFL